MKPRSERIGGYRLSTRPKEVQPHKIGRFAAEDLPAKVDLRDHLTEVEEQIGNSCVANAFAGAYEYLAKRSLGEASDISRLFIYYNARLDQGDADSDDGTEMYSAIEGLKKYGACNESFWPNEEDSIVEKPDDDAYSDAKNFKITSSSTVETDLTAWKHALAEGSPIAFAINTFDSFDDATNRKGRVPFPRSDDNVRDTHGWHAMLCVGYLERDQMFIVRNSWGTEWGDNGYCYIPYKYMMHPDLNADDSWIIKGVSDLDFSKDISSDANDSYFAGEGSLQLFDFYCETDDVEGFSTALESLCEAHSTEEGFYFDYEETTEDGTTYATVTNLDIAVVDSEAFEKALHAFCTKWAGGDNYDFTVESNGTDDSDSDVDVEEADEEEASSGDVKTVDLSFSEFYVYTDDADDVTAKVDKLCERFAVEGDDDRGYGYESEEDSDEGGNYVAFNNFIITTEDVDGFLAALQKLCEKVSTDAGYNWVQE